MLTACPQLHWLEVGGSDFSKVMPLFSCAVALTRLYTLDLSSCNISNTELIQLGEGIRFNRFLGHLNICNNQFSHRGLSSFLRFFVNNPLSRSTFLGLDLQINKEEWSILKEVNRFRAVRGYPCLTPKSYYMDNEIYCQEVMATMVLSLLHEFSSNVNLAKN